MPRKTRPTPIATAPEVNTVITQPIEPVPVKTEVTESKSIQSTQSSQEDPVTDPVTIDLSHASDPSDPTETKRPKKKLRRPTLSDTIPAIPVASFRRMARRMAEDSKSDMRWEGEALEALQVDAEAFLIQRFQKAKETMDLFGRKSGGRQLKELMRA